MLQAGITLWWYVGLAVLLEAVSWVRSSSGENFNVWVLTPIPQNSFLWEDIILRSRLCPHAFHRMSSKDPDIHVSDGWMSASKRHPARTIHKDGMWLPQWLDWKTVTQTSHPKWWTPEIYIAGECRRRRSKCCKNIVMYNPTLLGTVKHAATHS